MHDLVFYYPEGHEAHYEPGHPERPERIEVIRESLQKAGWWDNYHHLEPTSLSPEFLSSVHNAEYLAALEAACRQGAHLDADTYTTPASWRLAHNAAGGAVAVAVSVWEGKSKKGLALTRPPGHHATSNRGMGFCLLNNIAIAAEYLITGGGDNGTHAQRLAIVDIDLHHGNGTQDIFWNRGDVLYISTHQSPFYPGTGQSRETGTGRGEGLTANFPLPPGTGDLGFRAFMDELIIPILDRFSPQMLLISIGFDPHWRDPLGHLMLSAQGFGSLIRSLVKFADRNCEGRIALFLEGGYDLDAGAACLQAAVAALLDVEWQDYLGPSPRPEGKSWASPLRDAHDIWEF